MQTQNNPLLTPFYHPPFRSIRAEHVKPAVEKAIQECRTTIEAVVQVSEPTWETVVAPLEQADDRLTRIWSPISHMNSVVSQDDLREAHDACLELLSEYGTWVGQHEGLYNAYRKIADSPDFAALSGPQQRVITDTLRDFELSGVNLPPEQKKRYGEIQSRLSQLGSQFSNQLLDATQSWFCHVTDKARLSGLPESAVASAREAAEERELSGWVFTLDIPSYLPVMMYADDRELRREMQYAYITRASDQGPDAGKFDNSAIIDETLALRHELAQLLGFQNYAEVSLATKMADSPQQVMGFLEDLAARSLPQAKREFAEIADFAQKEHGVDNLEAWDVAYYAEKLKQSSYAISDEQLRPYFPEDRVVSGLFKVAEKLFSIRIQEAEADTWHPHVRYFEIYDAQNELRAGFYLDLYARAKKRGGAWMADCAVRRRLPDGQLQKPLAYLTCNFNKPVGDKPALFTHDEVITLFHEFGHGLHHMLTQIDVAGVSGINGVEWDAVELPSQFLENWCWEPEALAFISGHFETGEPLPNELLDKMLAARNFQAAMQMVRQLEFSLFDMRIHQEFSAESGARVQAILDEVRQQVAVFQPPHYNRFQHSFGHIFAGGYAAGYYSYKWAEVLSADAYARFEEEGIFNPQTGQDFLQKILEKGGSQDAMVLFTDFRGRQPDISALLRHSGIAA
ncbi:oligopeptidase A [Aliidiomarina sanyensis]|uniref:oligopeptidase A n=1 Tax=Aliidiomarina sanyensis TaxID=1249555 RepID=A0A432WKE7_9GAMM|nr:oligopeptidase A [Aliidiomarina sanyensis]RUO34169.1 oligopeptidase A [Aliidiomarina sanyensis]